MTQLKSLITQLGGKPEITDALIDWIDVDNIVTGTDGAEEEYYKALGYHCKNGPLDSPDELLLVKGFDRDWSSTRAAKTSSRSLLPPAGSTSIPPPRGSPAVLGTQTASFPSPLAKATSKTSSSTAINMTSRTS